MSELNKRDLYWVLHRLPRPVLDLMKGHRGLLLAGGFIRACVANEPPQDVDLFAADEERAGLYARILAGPGGSAYKSQNAYTVRRADSDLPIQVIHRWTYERPEDLAESFDFTVAKSVVWCAGERDVDTHRGAWRSVTHPDFYADLAARRLVYTAPRRNEDAGGSLLRVLKFYSRGYRIPLDSMGAVLARMAVAVREEALPTDLPREEALAKVLTGLLHEVDPQLDPQHVFHLPSTTDTDTDTTL